MVFMKIVSKKGVCDGFLCRLLLLKLIISMKRGYVYVWGMGENVCEFCRYTF